MTWALAGANNYITKMLKRSLISIIATDNILLEVFYAHTISLIAILTSGIMVAFPGSYH